MPSGEPERAVQFEQSTGEERAEHDGDRLRHDEERARPGAMARREPIGHEEEDARHETGFRQADQRAERIEAVGAGRKQRRGRRDPPGDHDARDPDLRAEARHHHVARDLRDHVGDVEDAAGQPERRCRQSEILVHRQGRKAHVDAIEIGTNEKQHEKPDETPIDLRHDRLLECPNLHRAERHSSSPHRSSQPLIGFIAAPTSALSAHLLGVLRIR